MNARLREELRKQLVSAYRYVRFGALSGERTLAGSAG
jgi:hypothetical protein